MLLDLPKLGTVKFDDNLTEDQLNLQLDALAKKYNFELPRGQLTTGEMSKRALTRGFTELGSTLTDVIPAMGASALGFNDYAKEQLEEAADKQKELSTRYAPQYRTRKDVKGISDVPGFALETVLENAPSILTSLVPGVGAEVAATRAGLGAAGKAVAGGAGAFLGSYAQNAPDTFQGIYEKTGQLAPGAAAIFGAGQAALDSILPAQVLNRLSGPMKASIVEKVLEKSGMDKALLRTITANTIQAMTEEGLTEGAQEALSIAAENFVAKHPQVFNSEDWDRIMESSVRGAVAGAPFGGASGAIEHSRRAYQAQLDAAKDQAKDTGKSVMLALPYDPKVSAPTEYGQQVIYVHPDGSTSQGSELSDEAFAQQYPKFTPPAPLDTQAALKANQIAINQGRKEEKQREAQAKLAQQNLKSVIAEIAPNNIDLLSLAQTPSPIQQTIIQQQAENDALAAKRNPPPKAAGVTPQPATTAEVVTPQQVSTVIDDNTFKALGIGPSAKIIRDKLIHGKDIADPAQAAEVKSILEDFANKTTSKKARDNIGAFLDRPEFKGVENVAGPNASTSGTSVPVAGQTSENAPAGGPTELESNGVVSTGENVEPTATGEAEQPLTVRKKAKGKKEIADEIKAETGEETAQKEQLDFVQQNEQNTNDLINNQVQAAAKDAGLRPESIDIEDHSNTDAHKTLRLPALLAEYFRLGEMIKADPAKAKKNQKERDVIKNAIDKSTPEAAKFLQTLERYTPAQRDALISEVGKQGRQHMNDLVKAKVDEAVKNSANKQKPAEQQINPEPEIDEAKIDEATKKLAEILHARGISRFFAPKFKGKDLNERGQELARQGNFNGLLDHLINTVTDPEIKQVLRKIRSLGNKPKIVIGPVEGDRPGSYDPVTNTITLDLNTGLNEHTVMHEMAHSALAHILENRNHPLTKEFVKFFDQIKNQLGNAYGGENLQEFAAELVGNQQFQALLKDIKAPKSKNMFVRILQTIAEALGFRKGQSAYDKGLKFINDLLDVSEGVESSASNKMFLGNGNAWSSLSDIGMSMPALGRQSIENAKNTFSNIKDFGWLKTAFKTLRLDNINTIYGKELPSIQTLLDAIETRTGRVQQERTKLENKVKEFRKIETKFPEAVKKMDDMAIDARLAGIELVSQINPNFKPDAKNLAEYNRLKSVYNSLPKEVREMYDSIRTDYQDAINGYLHLLIGDPAKGVPGMVEPGLAQKLKAQFEAEKRVAGYVPFKRYGNFWVEYADPATGERVASSFESIRERQQFVDANLKDTPHKLYRNLEDIRYQPGTIPPTRFIGNLMATLQKQGASQNQLDSVYQTYLSLFPAESINKQFMKSKNVLGMEKNTLRNYSNTMWSWTNKLANTEFGPKIDKAIEGIKTEASNANTLETAAVAETIAEQNNFFHNPTFGNLTHTATALSYFEYIAGNVSSAIVNLTSLPMLVWPTLGGKFGFGKTNSAMAAAGKLALGDWSKDARYKNLYQAMMDHDQLGHTTARNVLEAKGGAPGFSSLYGRILDGLSIPFSASERYNRATTGIAAYDLAKQSGMSEAEAIKYALTTTKDLHTSGLASTAPLWMQNPVGRVMFTFKSYAWNSAFVIARAFHQAFKNEDPAIQRAARRQLLGIFGMSMAFGGIKGLPFHGATTLLATMIQSLFGDDDEPFDVDEEMRDFFGEALYKGAFNYVTNLETSNRTGLATDLIFRDDPRGVADHGYALSAMQQAFGPAGTYLVNAENAIKLMKEGHTERAIESLLPSFIRNGFKGARYMNEGALTLKGDPVQEDISAWNSMMQVAGFAPAELSSIYEKTSAAKAAENQIKQRRTAILTAYDMARTSGDDDLMQEVRERQQKFNEAHPTDRITQESLEKSHRARVENEKNVINGVTFNKHLVKEIKQNYFNEE